MRALLPIVAVVAITISACGPQPGRASDTSVVPSSTGPAQASTDWDRIVAEANREGKVVVLGSPNNDLPIILTESFTKRYPQIAVEYSGAPGSQATPKLLTLLEPREYATNVIQRNGETNPAVVYIHSRCLTFRPVRHRHDHAKHPAVDGNQRPAVVHRRGLGVGLNRLPPNTVRRADNADTH